MKRKALMVALFCIMGLLLAGAAQATEYTCSIQSAGIIGSQYYVVFLTDTAQAPAWTGSLPFLIPTASQAIANGLYATALTAIANSTNVVIDVFNPGTLPPYSVIFSMSAVKP
jgi:hypothetical protein